MKEWHRYLGFVIFLLIIWASILGLLYLKADEVTRHPCSVCAMSVGENVYCTVGTTDVKTKTYYSDGGVVTAEGMLQNVTTTKNINT